jgi:hypothetical protein
MTIDHPAVQGDDARRRRSADCTQRRDRSEFGRGHPGSPTAEHVAGAPPYDPDLVAIPSVDYQGLYSYYGYGFDSLGFSAGYPYVIR